MFDDLASSNQPDTLFGAVAVAAGKPIFGKETSGKRVLYLGLEDNERRLQSRLRTACSVMDVHFKDFGHNIHVATTSADIKTGLLVQLDNWMKKYPDTGLIVIDMLKNVKPESLSNKQLYDLDAELGHALRHVAHTYPGLTVWAVHHMRKMEADDPHDMASGSTGLTGSFDTLMALVEDKDGNRWLDVCGKDTESAEIQLHMEPSGMYNLKGRLDLTTKNMSDTRGRVYMAIPKFGSNDVATQAGLATQLGISASGISQQLKKLLTANFIEKVDHGKYRQTATEFS